MSSIAIHGVVRLLPTYACQYRRGGRAIQRDSDGVDVPRLRAAYQSDRGVRLLLDHFGSRQRNQHTTPVDTLERALNAADTRLARHLIIDALRRLDALGLGRFVPGRKGTQPALSGGRRVCTPVQTISPLRDIV